MVVYHIYCRKCGPSQAYIGKTVNTLYEIPCFWIGALAPQYCAFHFEDVKILETGRYDHEIRFIESILLKYDRQNLNTCERSIPLEIV